MLNILYVHGYNGTPYGLSYKCLQNALDEKYGYDVRLFSLQYDQNKPESIVKELNKFISEHKIDILIGASLGGFIVSQMTSMPRIVLNPCMKPDIELPKLGCDEVIAKKYMELENQFTDLEDKMTIIGIFGNNDELLGDKYVEPFKKKYGILNNVKTVYSGHHMSESSAILIANSIPELISNCKEIGYFEQHKP